MSAATSALNAERFVIEPSANCSALVTSPPAPTALRLCVRCPTPFNQSPAVEAPAAFKVKEAGQRREVGMRERRRHVDGALVVLDRAREHEPHPRITERDVRVRHTVGVALRVDSP
jgi:hypothetical protein